MLREAGRSDWCAHADRAGQRQRKAQGHGPDAAAWRLRLSHRCWRNAAQVEPDITEIASLPDWVAILVRQVSMLEAGGSSVRGFLNGSAADLGIGKASCAFSTLLSGELCQAVASRSNLQAKAICQGFARVRRGEGRRSGQVPPCRLQAFAAIPGENHDPNSCSRQCHYGRSAHPCR